MRQLHWMCTAKQRDAWDRTASVLAVLVNVNRGKNDKAVAPIELNPYREAEAQELRRESNIEPIHLHRRLMFLPPEERIRILAKMEAEKDGKSD